MLPDSPWQTQVGPLHCLRGIDTLTAAGLCAEIGDIERFACAEQLMSYVAGPVVEHHRRRVAPRMPGQPVDVAPAHMGIAATGRRVRTTGMEIDLIRDGRVAAEWGESDRLGLLTQLGAVEFRQRA